MRLKPRVHLQGTPPASALMRVSPQTNFIVPYCAIVLHQQAFHEQKKRHFLYPIAAFFFMSALAVQYTLPDKESYAYQQFQENYKNSPLRWSAILLATGFNGALSKSDMYLKHTARAIEYYMEFRYHMVFSENRNPETQKQRVFFRGEKRKDADSVFFAERHRTPLLWSLTDGKLSAPYVKDAMEDAPYPNGFTKGLVSLTSCVSVTSNYGDAEAVLVVVPEEHRVACVGQHALRDSQNHQLEYVVAGIHTDEVLLIGYRDAKTHDLVEVLVNPRFRGKIENLELDKQMLPFLSLIKDRDMRKRLYQCIDSQLNYANDYHRHVSDTEESFLEKTLQRCEMVRSGGFRESEFLRGTHHFFHGSKDRLRKVYRNRLYHNRLKDINEAAVESVESKL